MKKKVVVLLSVVFGASIAACCAIFIDWGIKTEGDSVKPFTIDARQPFHLEFGRGRDGGLAVFILDESGRATVSELDVDRDTPCRHTTLTLTPAQLSDVIEAVNVNQLTNLYRSYSSGVADGTQWVFLVEQRGNRKVIYFDNYFPTAIKRFADAVDGVEGKAGRADAVWEAGGEQLQSTLWKANSKPH